MKFSTRIIKCILFALLIGILLVMLTFLTRRSPPAVQKTIVQPEKWSGQYTGTITNNMNLTTQDIESDDVLHGIHMGAVRHIVSKFPGADFARNRPYCFDKEPDRYVLGYRTKGGAPKHNYIVVYYFLENREYHIHPTR
jgi:hypothetical protein